MSTTDTEGLHPDDLRRRLPSITTPLTPDTERDERLRGIQERAAAATEGPWTTYQTAVHEGSGVAVDDDEAMLFWNAGGGLTATSPENAGFIAAARTDVPWLLAEVTRLDAVVTEREATIESERQAFSEAYALQVRRTTDALAVVTAVREVHRYRYLAGDAYLTCDGCGYIADDEDDPCPTRRALDGGAS